MKSTSMESSNYGDLESEHACDRPKVIVSYPQAIACDESDIVESASVESRKPTKPLRVRTQVVKSRIPIKCKRCRESFESVDELAYHRTYFHTVRGHRSFTCHLCRKSLANIYSLRHHINAIHISQKPYKCTHPKCAKTFAVKAIWRRHINTRHSDDAAYRCNTCLKKYRGKHSLTKHMVDQHGQEIALMKLEHRSLKPFKCRYQGCLRAYTEERALRRHTNIIHTKEIVFECPKCRERFYDKDHLTTHLGFEHGDGSNYSCHLCKKSLKTRPSILLHMKSIHVGLKPFKCPECCRAFSQKPHLRRHLSAIHTNRVPI